MAKIKGNVGKKFTKGFTRPEGAGNFENMDDNNIVRSINIKFGTAQETQDRFDSIANKKYVDDKLVESFPTSLTSGSVVFSDGTNLAQDNSNLFWDNVNKRLGIGTIIPQELLHVKQAGDNAFIEMETTLSNGAAQFKFTGPDQEWRAGQGITDQFVIRDQTGAANPLTIENGCGANRIYVDSTGNVGIGVTNPANVFETKVTTANTTDLSGALRLSKYSYGNNADGSGPAFVFELGDSGATEVIGRIGAVRDGADDEGALMFLAGTDGNEQFMKIDNDGNVGINTISPDTKLQVVGTTRFGDDAGNRVDIDGTGNQVFVGGAGLCFGGISFYNNTTADTIATATSTQLTRFDTNDPSNNCTPDHTNDHITITKAGMYKVTMDVSFSGTGSVEWTGGVYKNNGGTQLTNLQTSRKLGASGDVGSAGVSGIADLAVNDTVEIWFEHAAGVNKNITVKHCTLSVVQIGGT